VFGRTPPEGLLQRSWSRFERAIIYRSFKIAPTFLFFTKNGSSYNTFGRAYLEESEPDQEEALIGLTGQVCKVWSILASYRPLRSTHLSMIYDYISRIAA
jgi:hypothetical protein